MFSFDPKFLDEAFQQAMADANQSAIPIGAVMVYDDGNQQEVFFGKKSACAKE